MRWRPQQVLFGALFNLTVSYFAAYVPQNLQAPASSFDSSVDNLTRCPHENCEAAPRSRPACFGVATHGSWHGHRDAQQIPTRTLRSPSSTRKTEEGILPQAGRSLCARQARNSLPALTLCRLQHVFGLLSKHHRSDYCTISSQSHVHDCTGHSSHDADDVACISAYPAMSNRASASEGSKRKAALASFEQQSEDKRGSFLTPLPLRSGRNQEPATAVCATHVAGQLAQRQLVLLGLFPQLQLQVGLRTGHMQMRTSASRTSVLEQMLRRTWTDELLQASSRKARRNIISCITKPAFVGCWLGAVNPLISSCVPCDG